MIRSFVAIPVPDQVSATLETVQASLRSGRLVPAESMHVTLAFLDAQPAAVLEDLDHELAKIDLPAFDLRLDGVGMFGGAEPRVLFASVVPDRALKALRDQVRRAARTVGIELPHERWRPHVTIARFGKGLTGEEAATLQVSVKRHISLKIEPFHVSGFGLFDSKLGHEGPVYQCVAEFALGGD